MQTDRIEKMSYFILMSLWKVLIDTLSDLYFMRNRQATGTELNTRKKEVVLSVDRERSMMHQFFKFLNLSFSLFILFSPTYQSLNTIIQVTFFNKYVKLLCHLCSFLGYFFHFSDSSSSLLLSKS